MKTLIKLDRISAWILFISMLLYFITGYGMTKGIIDSSFAASLHNNYLTYIILISFVFHTAFAIRLAFIRWKVWNSGGQAAWLVFYAIFISWFIYMESFYAPASTKKNEFNSTESVSSQAATTQNISVSTENEQTFTKDELAKYNGQNGSSAYVAVDGVVYDMSSVFKNGTHFSHIAGTELTNAFYSYHAKSSITKYPVIGKYSR